MLVVIATGLTAYYLGTKSTTKPSTSSTTPLSATIPPKHDVSGANMEAAWADFVEIVGKDNVSTMKTDREHHAGSEWSTHISKEGEIPFLVVFPESTEEVSRIMKICHRRKIPATAYAGGRSLEGVFAATRGGICIDFGRMGKILKLHKEDMDVVVQPAVG